MSTVRTILFEINEVPWRVVDWYCDRHPEAALAKIRAEGRSFTTHTEDSGHLHPWVTWPSLHRGVNNDRHDIRHLGQDLTGVDAEFPTLWQILARNGHRVGVAGSLQTYPLPTERSAYDFYIPDTYAPQPETIPAALSTFQDINLRLTKQNSRNVTRGIEIGDALRFAAALPANGLRLTTALGIAQQILREMRDTTKLNRRRAIQAALYFDVFLRQLESRRPEFCTFFTNHVAASMHRFWAAAFPADYSEFNLPGEWVKSYSGEIEWAMAIADQFLARLVQFCCKNPDYRLLVASSMGQAATNATGREGYYAVGDVVRFFGALGVGPDEIRPAMAMAPDISVHLLTDNARERFRAVEGDLERALGDIEAEIDEKNFLHMHVMAELDAENPLTSVMIGNRELPLEELGLRFVADQDRVATTAYHVPEGILLAWSRADAARETTARRRDSIGALDVAPAILAAHGVTAPDYMRRTSIVL
jgi:hypothetical protein